MLESSPGSTLQGSCSSSVTAAATAVRAACCCGRDEKYVSMLCCSAT